MFQQKIFWLLVPHSNLAQEFAGYPYLQFMSSWFLAFQSKVWLASNLSYTFNSESQTGKEEPAKEALDC